MTFPYVIKILQGIIATIGIGFVCLMSLPFLPLNGMVELFSVRSGSMEPTLPTGSLIFVRPANEYVVGDIVTIQTTDEKTVTHRITQVLNTDVGVAFQTKGDNNEDPDPVDVVPADIIGKTFLMLPLLGYPVSYAQTQGGFLALIVFPAVLIMLSEILTISGEIRRLWRKRFTTEHANEAMARNVTFAPMPSSVYSFPTSHMSSTSLPRKRII